MKASQVRVSEEEIRVPDSEVDQLQERWERELTRGTSWARWKARPPQRRKPAHGDQHA